MSAFILSVATLGCPSNRCWAILLGRLAQLAGKEGEIAQQHVSCDISARSLYSQPQDSRSPGRPRAPRRP